MRYLFLLSLVVGIAGCDAQVSNLDTPPPAGAMRAAVNEIKPQDALPKTQAAYAQFIDVRTPEEYAAGHAARSVNIPLNELPSKLERIEKNEPVYVICESGRRSKEASDILVKNGFNWVFTVTGGTAAWRAENLPIVKQ